MIILGVIGIVLVGGFVWLIWLFVHAPEGYETDCFHRGRKP